MPATASLAIATHSPQMRTSGPAIIRRTSCVVLAQNEHRSSTVEVPSDGATASASAIADRANARQLSQMYTPGPATNADTDSRGDSQNVHVMGEA